MTAVLFRCECLGLAASTLLPGTWSLGELLGTGAESPAELAETVVLPGAA